MLNFAVVKATQKLPIRPFWRKMMPIIDQYMGILNLKLTLLDNMNEH